MISVFFCQESRGKSIFFGVLLKMFGEPHFGGSFWEEVLLARIHSRSSSPDCLVQKLLPTATATTATTVVRALFLTPPPPSSQTRRSRWAQHFELQRPCHRLFVYSNFTKVHFCCWVATCLRLSGGSLGYGADSNLPVLDKFSGGEKHTYHVFPLLH